MAVDAVQEPLAQIPLKMKQKIGNGIFVVRSAMPHLLIGKLGETSIDVILGELHPLHRGGKKYISDLFRHKVHIIDVAGQVLQARWQAAARHA
jgi:hypothetical protein